MEKEGIGRPATYQISIQKLLEKNYIIKKSFEGNPHQITKLRWTPQHEIHSTTEIIHVGKESNKFYITELGFAIIQFLQQYFSFLLNISFTREMELKLDQILSQSTSKIDIVTLFYSTLKPLLHQSFEKIPSVSNSNNLQVYKYNNKSYYIRKGPYGYYLHFLHQKKSKNIGLQAYLSHFNLHIEELTLMDIVFLLSFPYIYTMNGIKYVLEYGRYGFYCKNEKEISSIIDQLRKQYLSS
jgi:hypothetical protein